MPPSYGEPWKPLTERGEPAGPERRSLKGCFIGVIATVAVLAVVVILCLIPEDIQTRPPRLDSPVWAASVNGRPRLYYVTKEERSQTRYRGRVYPYTVNYSVFTLLARDAHSGEIAQQRELARIDNAVDGPGIVGPQGNVLWLWDRGLTAVDLGTLKPAWSIDTLKQANPELGAFLSPDRKYYKVLKPFEALVFKGTDARYYRADGTTGKIDALDSTALAKHDHFGRAEQAFSELPSPGEPELNLSLMGVLWNSFTHDGHWYALLTVEERAKLSSRPRRGNTASGEESRQVYHAPYTPEDRPLLGTTEALIDPAIVALLNSERYVMGGFLLRPARGGLWWPEGGTDVLILHKQQLGENTPWLLTRLRLDGTVAWTCPVGLADFRYLCDAGDTVVFMGYADRSEPTNDRPELFVLIDEKTGVARKANVH